MPLSAVVPEEYHADIQFSSTRPADRFNGYFKLRKNDRTVNLQLFPLRRHFLVSSIVRSVRLRDLLMGFIKSKVFQTRHAGLRNLKQRISEET